MTDSAGNTAQLLELRIDRVEPWPNLNPRKRFDEEALAELTQSVKEKGLLEPLLVHKSVNPNQKYWIVAGERRYRAAKAAGLETVPCIVRSFERAEALEVAIVENLQRTDITPIEEASGFADWLQTTRKTQTELAEKIGRSQPYISNRIRILDLPVPILDLVEAGAIDFTVARDELLPFTKVQPEAQAAAFFEKLAPALKRAAKKGELEEDWGLRSVITKAVEKVGRPMTAWTFHGTSAYDDAARLLSNGAHESCSCGSPVRNVCFDVDAWEKRVEKAKEREAAAEGKKEESREAARARLAKQPIVREETLLKNLGHNGYTVLTDHRSMKGLYDPDALDPETLTWGRLTTWQNVDGKGYRQVEYVGLVSVEPSTAKRASAAGEEEYARRLDARRKERAERERVEAARGTLTAEVLRSLFVAPEEAVADVLSDLELVDRGKINQRYRWKTEAAALEAVSGLSKTQLEVAAKVVALRADAGYLTDDPVSGEVFTELKAEYEAALEALLPPLPEGVEIDAHSMEDEGDEEGGEEPEPESEATRPGPEEEEDGSPADDDQEDDPGPEEEDEDPVGEEEVIGDGPFAIRPGALRTIVYDTRTGETVGARIRERDARRYAQQKNEEAEAEAVTA